MQIAGPATGSSMASRNAALLVRESPISAMATATPTAIQPAVPGEGLYLLMIMERCDERSNSRGLAHSSLTGQPRGLGRGVFLVLRKQLAHLHEVEPDLLGVQRHLPRGDVPVVDLLR